MERDDKDYVIEFGHYLATATQRLLEAIENPELYCEEDATTAATRVRSAIYEFRKRAEKVTKP